MATLHQGLLLWIRPQVDERVGQCQGSPKGILQGLTLTVWWRRATLAVDKVVRPTNLAGNTGALAAGQWTIMTVYVTSLRTLIYFS